MYTNEKYYKRIRLVLYLSIISLIFIAFALSYTFYDHRKPEDGDVVKVVNEHSSTENRLSDVIIIYGNKDSKDISILNSVNYSCDHSKQLCKDCRNIGFSQENENIQSYGDNDTEYDEDSNNRPSEDNNNIQPHEYNNTGHDKDNNNQQCEDNNNEYSEDNNNTQPHKNNDTGYDKDSNTQQSEDTSSHYREYNSNAQLCEDGNILYVENNDIRPSVDNNEYSRENSNTQPNEKINSVYDEDKNTGYDKDNNTQPNEKINSVYDEVNNLQPREDNKAQKSIENNNIQPCEDNNTLYGEDNNIQPYKKNNIGYDKDNNTQSHEKNNIVYNEFNNVQSRENNDSIPCRNSNNTQTCENNVNEYDENSNNTQTCEDNVTVWDKGNKNIKPCRKNNSVYDDINVQPYKDNNSGYSGENNNKQTFEDNNAVYEDDKNTQQHKDNNVQMSKENKNILQCESSNNKQTRKHNPNISPFRNHRYTHHLNIDSTGQHNDEEVNTKVNEINVSREITIFEETTCRTKNIQKMNLKTSNDITNIMKHDSSYDKFCINYKNNHHLDDIYKPESKVQSISHEHQINNHLLKIIRQFKRNNFKSIYNQNKKKLKYKKRIKFKNRRKIKILKRFKKFKKTKKTTIRSQSIADTHSFDKNISIVATKASEKKTKVPLHSSLIGCTKNLRLGNNMEIDSQLVEHKQNFESKEDLSVVKEQLIPLKSSADKKVHVEHEWLKVFNEKHREHNETRNKWEIKLIDLLNDFYKKFFEKQQGLFYQIYGLQLHLPFNIDTFCGNELIPFYEDRLKEICKIFMKNNIYLLKKQSELNDAINNHILIDFIIHIKSTCRYCIHSSRVTNLNIIKIIILELELNEIQINHITELIVIYNKSILVFKDIIQDGPPKYKDIWRFYKDLIAELRDLNAYKEGLEKRKEFLKIMYNGW